MIKIPLKQFTFYPSDEEAEMIDTAWRADLTVGSRSEYLKKAALYYTKHVAKQSA